MNWLSRLCLLMKFSLSRFLFLSLSQISFSSSMSFLMHQLSLSYMLLRFLLHSVQLSRESSDRTDESQVRKIIILLVSIELNFSILVSLVLISLLTWSVCIEYVRLVDFLELDGFREWVMEWWRVGGAQEWLTGFQGRGLRHVLCSLALSDS